MPYMDFAGVDYAEKTWDSSVAIDGGATDVCGVIIIAEKGPINKRTLIKSIDQAKAIFGSYLESAYGMYTIDGFFKNGGRSLWVVRVAHYSDITDAATLTAVKASLQVNDKRTTNSEPTLTVTDKWHGALGNKHGVKIINESSVMAKVSEAIIVGATVIPLGVVRNFSVGDYVNVTDAVTGTLTENVKIESVDIANRTIHVTPALANAYTVDSVVKTLDFTLEVYYKNTSGDQLEKSFVGVNMDPTSPKYVLSVVGNATSGSTLIDLEDEFITVAQPYEKIPKATNGIVYMTGGNDGLVGFVDADIIGDSLSKTGRHAFDTYEGMIHIYCPESASKEVIQSGFDYATAKMTAMYFAYVPSGLDPQGAADFRDASGFNTSYGALYYNWGYVIDPIGIGDSPKKLIPLTGHILGAMAKNDRTNEDLYGSAPAGEKMALLGVDSLEFEVDKTNGGVLYGDNNRNINPIVSLSGNGGICVWGSRTQSNVKKWMQIHARRIFIFAETSIVVGTRWSAFQNKNDRLYNQMQRTVKKFLKNIKGLKGDVDAERFEFVCDATINDAEDPYVLSRVGLNIVGVGEFIYFEFGQKPEGVSLAEL